MSNNAEFHMWKEHEDHEITVHRKTWPEHDELGILCHTCKKLVQVWEFIPEYEENYEEA